MWKTVWLVVMVPSLVVSRSERPVAQAPAPEPSISSPDAGLIPRVRSTDERVSALIARAVEQSAAFRSLRDKIVETDGIVYVEPGRCGALRACLALKVTAAGPNRILFIFIDLKRDACDVMASIGHELWHAIEVLREQWIRTDGAMYSFIARGREQDPPAWVETEAAIRIGEDVRRELREPCA
jgi:hypothetical protein